MCIYVFDFNETHHFISFIIISRILTYLDIIISAKHDFLNLTDQSIYHCIICCVTSDRFPIHSFDFNEVSHITSSVTRFCVSNIYIY